MKRTIIRTGNLVQEVQSINLPKAQLMHIDKHYPNANKVSLHYHKHFQFALAKLPSGKTSIILKCILNEDGTIPTNEYWRISYTFQEVKPLTHYLNLK